jgi:ferredoxin
MALLLESSNTETRTYDGDMNPDSEILFEAFLNRYDDTAWAEAVTGLLPAIHEVDRAATQIWFAFYPLALARALQQAEDSERLARDLLLDGNYQLRNQIDSSHSFFYGHRYWPQIKQAIIENATRTVPPSLELATQITGVAEDVSARAGVGPSLLIGITAAGFMTLVQAGIAAFKEFPGRVQADSRLAGLTPEQILKRRARDDSQGLFGFLRGEAKVYTITFNENEDGAKFKLISSQHLTTAAALDKRNHHLRDPRCTRNEGPIPVQCRAASCGTCWVGILGGAEKLSAVGALESRRIKEFGYVDTDEPHPMIRLACQAQAFGAVSIVIPPWNGVFGKLAGRRETLDATTAP